jgi:RNA polymerase sigma factor (sigma-70 family)
LPEPQHRTDLELVERAIGRDPAAVDEMAERLACVPGILRTKARRMGIRLDPDQLADLTQEAYEAIWRKLDTFAGHSKLETWAFGFCVLQLFKWFDSGRREAWRRSEELLHEPIAPVQERAEDASFEPVHRAVARLGRPASSIIHLKHFEGLTFDAIGARLDASPNTVRSQYYRAIRRLRVALSSYWEEGRAR